ncbi:MAG: alpha amylase family protein [Cyclonatronaceae bacterium]
MKASLSYRFSSIRSRILHRSESASSGRKPAVAPKSHPFGLAHALLPAIALIIGLAACSPDADPAGEPSEDVRRKILWFDASANFERLSYPDSISYYLDLTRDAGITDVVLDLKPISGHVMYESRYAPQWITHHSGLTRETDMDLVRYFIDEARDRGLTTHFSMNVFVGGHNYHDIGLVYELPEKTDWQAINYTPEGMRPITDLKQKYSAMLIPSHSEVQQFNLNVMREIIQKYDFDGVILDRVRFDGIQSDFSPVSRYAFEEYLGTRLQRFPEDIYEWVDVDGEPERRPGPYYQDWLTWRTSVIYNFLEQAREVAKETDPDIIFGNYTGAWYPVYYEVGVNYASQDYDPHEEYDWANEDYHQYGFAGLLDLFTTGNYFFEVTEEEVEALNEEEIQRNEAGMGTTRDYWYSVEGSARITREVVKDEVPIYCGLYVEQYDGHPEQFVRASEMCREMSDGLMIFDIVHIINYDWWDVLAESTR